MGMLTTPFAYLISLLWQTANINCKNRVLYHSVRAISDHTYKTANIILLWNFVEPISCPYKPRSGDPTLIFGALNICTVNHRPQVGLCLDSNEDRGTTEHLASLDQLGTWFRKCEVVSFYGLYDPIFINCIHHLHLFKFDGVDYLTVNDSSSMHQFDLSLLYIRVFFPYTFNIWTMVVISGIRSSWHRPSKMT